MIPHWYAYNDKSGKPMMRLSITEDGGQHGPLFLSAKQKSLFKISYWLIQIDLPKMSTRISIKRGLPTQQQLEQLLMNYIVKNDSKYNAGVLLTSPNPRDRIIGRILMGERIEAPKPLEPYEDD